MQTLQQSYVPVLTSERRKQSIITQFLSWCKGQDENGHWRHGISLITNLSALPTKITIPVFFLSIAIDLVAIGLSFTSII